MGKLEMAGWDRSYGAAAEKVGDPAEDEYNVGETTWGLEDGEEYVVNTDVVGVLSVRPEVVVGAVLNRPTSCSLKFGLERLGKSTVGSPMGVFDDW